MEQDRDFQLIIRRLKKNSLDTEDCYRIMSFKKFESMDELLMHPTVEELIGKSIVHVERVDNYRWNLFIVKS